MVAGCSYTTSWLLRNQADILLTLSLYTSTSHFSQVDYTCRLTGFPQSGHVNWQSMFQKILRSTAYSNQLLPLESYPFPPMKMCVQSIIYLQFFFNTFHDSYTSCSLLLFFPPFLSVFSVAHQISILHTVFLASPR